MFGPFSTLLTAPAARVAARYGYAFVEGAGGAPSVFGEGLHNVFDVSIPVKNNLVTFAQWLASLPPSQRPKTAAYVTINDPFTQPQFPVAQQILQSAGIKTVLNKVFPAEVSDYTAIAGQVASSGAQAVLLGSVDVPTVSAFVHTFIQQHYNPKAFIATAGPDQGAQFVKAVGAGNENGIFVPNGWYGGFKKADSEKMVQEYIAKYGGTPSDVNADVAEAYSVGQVLAAGRQGDRRLQPAEDPQLPARRRDDEQRPGPGEVRLTRREPRPEDADLPVAERKADPDDSDPPPGPRSRSTRSRPGPDSGGGLRRTSVARAAARHC